MYLLPKDTSGRFSKISFGLKPTAHCQDFDQLEPTQLRPTRGCPRTLSRLVLYNCRRSQPSWSINILNRELYLRTGTPDGFTTGLQCLVGQSRDSVWRALQRSIPGHQVGQVTKSIRSSSGSGRQVGQVTKWVRSPSGSGHHVGQVTKWVRSPNK